MAGLAPHQAQALLALAEHGDYEAAAALGLPYGAFGKRLSAARAAFMTLWHEHETPPGRWRTDKRLYPPQRARRPGRDAIRRPGRVRWAGRDRQRRPAGPAGRRRPCSVRRLDHFDPNTFLAWHDVTRRRVATDGDQRKRVGYRLEDITTALAGLTAPGTRSLAA